MSDLPLQDPETVWFTGGSSLVQEGHMKLDFAVVTAQEITKANPLPLGPPLKSQRA